MAYDIKSSFEMKNGVKIPALGLGVWRVGDEGEMRASVEAALGAGYLHIDTASAYGNEDMVGRAVADFGERKNIFITTKLWNKDHLNAEASFAQSLINLKTDYVDLYLIHWPAPKTGDFVAAWKSLVKIYESGRARAIGVSNFKRHHIEKIIAETGFAPHMNQVERHPLFQQNDIKEYCESIGTLTTSYSPLGSGNLAEIAGMVKPVADKHGKTPAQVILRWHLQTGWVLIPKSVTPSRVRENSEIFDFELDGNDMKTMADIDCGKKFLPDPDLADF